MADEKKAFRTGWSIVKNEDDVGCHHCGEGIPNGKQYGCEYCGEDVCEQCMTGDNGNFDHSGYRGQIDDPHPLENHEEFNGGAYCPSCASDMMSDGSLDDEGQRIPEDDTYVSDGQRMSPHSSMGLFDEEEDPTSPEMSDELRRRQSYMEMEPYMNEEEKKLHMAEEISRTLGIKPPNPFSTGSIDDFRNTWKSGDEAFDTGWAVVKDMNEIPTDECKGCGLAHGSPNSEYCSDQCERQNRGEK